MTNRLSIALAQMNPTLGDIEGNLALHRRLRAEAAARDVDLVACAELSICGYPPEDLVLKPSFQEACRTAVETLAAETADGGPAMLVGTPWRENGKLYNAYALLANLPSVDTGKDSEGRPIIIGVTNYFRTSSPARVADLDLATRLQRSHPMLEYQSMWTRFALKKLDPLAWGAVPLRTEYIRELRALQAAHGERLWPESQYFLWQALIREKDFAAACDALRAYHVFEPSLYHRERWLRLSDQYRGDVGNAGGPADARCELPLPRK